VPRAARASAGHRAAKTRQRERDVAEVRALGLAAPPAAHRCTFTSLRCPPPCLRVLTTAAKGRWCGKPVAEVLRSEFSELTDAEHLSFLMDGGLVRLNNTVVKCSATQLDGVSASTPLKNMDVISRVVHWHEPPVTVPSSIPVRTHHLPEHIVNDYHLCDGDNNPKDSVVIYCCDKPATVPVHPAGPYLANSLTMMIEGQEKLEPRSLRPCHRLDRCTSGLTLCTTSPAAARLLQGRLADRTVRKQYLARIWGRFPSSEQECREFPTPREFPAPSWNWKDAGDGKCFVEVSAPIENIDPMNGVRAIREGGKSSTSRFRLVSHDNEGNTSIVVCYPVTGRGHQLRLHLQWLGHPVLGDIQYGGPRGANNKKDWATKALLDATKVSEGAVLNPDISEEDARAAQKLCRVCARGAEGVKVSFSSSQLLDGSHAIDLHAWKYQVTFHRKGGKRKKRKKDEEQVVDIEDPGDVPTIMDFATEVPSWAEACRGLELNWL